MAAGDNDNGGGLKHLLRLLAEAGDWVYAAFWAVADDGRSISWNNGYYNGPQMIGKDANAGGAVLETLKEAFESRRQALDQLTEMTLKKKKPGTEAASMLTAGLMETEWFYANNTTLQFPLGSGVVGRCALTGKYAWLCEADKMDSAIFTRAADAKAAGIQTILCVPVQGGVVELGTTKLAQEETLLVKMVQTMFSTHNRPANLRVPIGGFIRSNPLGSLCQNPSASLCHSSGATFGHSINGTRGGRGGIDYSHIRPGLPRSTGTEPQDYFASASAFLPKTDRPWPIGSSLPSNCVTPTTAARSLPMSAARLLYNPPTSGLGLMSDLPALDSSVGTTGMKGKPPTGMNLCHRSLNNGAGIDPALPLQGLNARSEFCVLRGLDPSAVSFAQCDNPKDVRLLLPADQIVAQARTANGQVLFNPQNILKGSSSLCIPSLQGLSTPINPRSCSNYTMSLQAEIRRQQQQQSQEQAQQFGRPIFMPVPNNQQHRKGSRKQENKLPVDISHVRHAGTELPHQSKGLTHLYSPLPDNSGGKLLALQKSIPSPLVASQSYCPTAPVSTAASICDINSQDFLHCSQARHAQAVQDDHVINELEALPPLDFMVPRQDAGHWSNSMRGDGTLLDVVLQRSIGKPQRRSLEDPYFLSSVRSSSACQPGAQHVPETDSICRAESDLQHLQTTVDDVLIPMQKDAQHLHNAFRQQQPENNSQVDSSAAIGPKHIRGGGVSNCSRLHHNLALDSGKEGAIEQQLAENSIEQHLKELRLPSVGGGTDQADLSGERHPRTEEDDLVKLVRQHSKKVVSSPEISGTSPSCREELFPHERTGSISRQGSFGSLGSLTSKRQQEPPHLTEQNTTGISGECTKQEKRFSPLMLPSSPGCEIRSDPECDQPYGADSGSGDPEGKGSVMGCSPGSLLTGAGSNHVSEVPGQDQVGTAENEARRKSSFDSSSLMRGRVGLDFAEENPLISPIPDWRLGSEMTATDQQALSPKESSESSDALFDTDGEESSSSSSSRNSHSEGMSELTGLFPHTDKADDTQFLDHTMTGIGQLQKEIGGGELTIERRTPVSLSSSRESEGSSDVGLLGGSEGFKMKPQLLPEDKWCPADVSTPTADASTPMSALSTYTYEYEMRRFQLAKLILSRTDHGTATDTKTQVDKPDTDADLACKKSMPSPTCSGEGMNGKSGDEGEREYPHLKDVEVEFHISGSDRINFRLCCRKQHGLYGKVMLALDYLRVKIVEASMTTENSMVVFELSIVYGGSTVQDILNALKGAAQEEGPLPKPPRLPQVLSPGSWVRGDSDI